jgi:hypothetical protein
VVLVVLMGTAGTALAQTDAPAAAPSEGDTTVARVHAEGGYPSDIVVLDDDDGGDAEERAARGEGAGGGPHGRVGDDAERDGGDPNRSTEIHIPFVQELLDALANVLGVAARPIGYLLFALGIALVIALIVYLVVMMRLPKADLATTRRRDGGSSSEPILDPLLAGGHESPEDLAAAGRYREAIHALFLRALREATKAGDVDRRGRTAREVVRLVQAMHGAIEPLDAILGLTELVWFGGREATEAQYHEARDLTAQVEARARTMGATTAAAPMGLSA